MKKKAESENGAIAIEAVIGITFFMIAVLSIMCLSLAVRVQANMQYALDQTAKEISGYFYLVDKMGIASILCGTTNDADAKNIKNVDELIGNVVKFSGEAESEYNMIVDGNSGDMQETLERLASSESQANLTEIKQTITALKTNLTQAKSAGIMKQAASVLSAFVKGAVNKYVTKYVGSFACRLVISKYLGDEGDNAADNYLKAVGIENGLDEIDFTESEILADGRSVKIVAVYTINAKELTLGMVNEKWAIRQVASTAAWIEPTEGSSKHKLKDVIVK